MLPMPVEKRTRLQYDFPTAVTFLLFGLGIGTVLTRLVFALKSGHSSHSQRPPRDLRHEIADSA